MLCLRFGKGFKFSRTLQGVSLSGQSLARNYRQHQRGGIVDMEIYLVENRLFMIVEVDETFSPERKKKLDEGNPKVQEREQLMWKFQQALPSAMKGEKWVATERIFKLD